MSRKPNPFKAIEAKMSVKERRLRQGRRKLVSVLRKRMVVQATQQNVPTKRIAQLAEMIPIAVSQLVHKLRAQGKIKSKAVWGRKPRTNETIAQRVRRQKKLDKFSVSRDLFIKQNKMNEKTFDRMASSYKLLFEGKSFVEIQTRSPERMAYELLNSREPTIKVNAPYLWVYSFVTWAKAGDWGELKQETKKP